MGADGWIDIYDADKVDAYCKEHDLDFDENAYGRVYKRTIFGRNVYTLYDDTESYNDDVDSIFDQFIIDRWEVWT